MPLGSSVGVNKMWTKRNDYASKVNVSFFLMPKKGLLKKNQFKFVGFSCLHLVFPEKYIPLKNYDNIISLPWPLVFFYYNTSFTSPTAKLIGPCQWIM